MRKWIIVIRLEQREILVYIMTYTHILVTIMPIDVILILFKKVSFLQFSWLSLILNFIWFVEQSTSVFSASATVLNQSDFNKISLISLASHYFNKPPLTILCKIWNREIILEQIFDLFIEGYGFFKSLNIYLVYGNKTFKSIHNLSELVNNI